MTGVTAFVLAGGQSSRMGMDKAFVELDGQPLIKRMLSIARTLDRDAHVVGDREKFQGFAEVVEDEFRGCGPLAGIHAALLSSRTGLNLILAVDIPFVQPQFLRYLIDQSASSSAMVTVPRLQSGWQPLCAVYRRGFAEVAGKSLREGKYKIDPLFRQVEVRSIGDNELLEHGFAVQMFQNLNTPEDVRSALSERKVPERPEPES